MTRDDVIRLAKEAGDDVEHTLPSDIDFLVRFAALVAAHEREECAKVCESMQDAVDRHKRPNGYACAASIRERGE